MKKKDNFAEIQQETIQELLAFLPARPEVEPAGPTMPNDPKIAADQVLVYLLDQIHEFARLKKISLSIFPPLE